MSLSLIPPLVLFLCLLLLFLLLHLPSSALSSLPLRLFFSSPLLLSPPSPIPHPTFLFPLWFLLLSPLTPLSRLLSRFSIPFPLRLSFRFFLLCPLPQFLSSSCVSVSFPLPSSSLHAASSSCYVLSASLVSSSSSSLSPGSLLFPFSESSLLLFLHLLPIVPFLGLLHLVCFLGIFLFFFFLGFVLFLCLASSSSFSSSSISCFPSSRAPFVSFSVVSSLSALAAFHPSPGFPPLPPPPGFRSSYFSGFSSSSLFLFSLRFCHSVVLLGSSSCLSLLFGRPGCSYSLLFFLFPFLLFSCGFRFVFGFVVDFVSLFQSLARWCFLSGGSVSVRIFLPSILSSPLMPLVFSPLALLSSSPLFVRLPLLCLLLLFLRWLLSPPLALRLLSFRLLLSLLPLLSL